MLFHLTHVHNAETCFAHKPDTLKMLADALKSAPENGIRVHSLYVAPWEHTFYGVLEADSSESLSKFIDPLLELGNGTITPVTDVVAEIGRRLGTS